jgi:hypothetical protein
VSTFITTFRLIFSCTKHYKGFNANRRHTPPRTHAKGQTVPRHRPLRILLSRLRPSSRGRPLSRSPTLLPTFRAPM